MRTFYEGWDTRIILILDIVLRVEEEFTQVRGVGYKSLGHKSVTDRMELE